MEELSTKPYLLRAIHEWCSDCGYTPYIAVSVDARTRVPKDFVRAGEIVLNISMTATQGLNIGADWIEFQARFGGRVQELLIPIDNVSAIYARENGHGMAFEVVKPPAELEPEAGDDRVHALRAVDDDDYAPSGERSSTDPNAGHVERGAGQSADAKSVSDEVESSEAKPAAKRPRGPRRLRSVPKSNSSVEPASSATDEATPGSAADLTAASEAPGDAAVPTKRRPRAKRSDTGNASASPIPAAPLPANADDPSVAEIPRRGATHDDAHSPGESASSSPNDKLASDRADDVSSGGPPGDEPAPPGGRKGRPKLTRVK